MRLTERGHRVIAALYLTGLLLLLGLAGGLETGAFG